MYRLFNQIVYKWYFTGDLPFQAVSIGAKLLIKSSSCLSWVRNGSSLSRRRAQGPSHLALSGSGWASRNSPARPWLMPALAPSLALPPPAPPRARRAPGGGGAGGGPPAAAPRQRSRRDRRASAGHGSRRKTPDTQTA